MVAISKILAATATALALPVVTASPIIATPPPLINDGACLGLGCPEPAAPNDPVDGVVITQEDSTINDTNNEATASEDHSTNATVKRDDVVTKHWDLWPEHQKVLALGTFVDDFHLRMKRVNNHYQTSIEEWEAMVVLIEMQDLLQKPDWQSFHEWSNDGANFYTFMTAVECRMDRAGLFKLQRVPWNCDEFCKKYKVCGGE